MSTNGVRAGSGSDSLDVVIQRDAAVPMRDGVVLRADVYRPARGATPVEEQLPTVLVRTSYDKSAPGDNIDPFSFAEHGYAVVLQDVRGGGRRRASTTTGSTRPTTATTRFPGSRRSPGRTGRSG